jgi:ABC-2 type transport system permease protein
VSAAGQTARQVQYENRAFWRNPAAAFFTVVLPLMFLVLFNAIFRDDDIDVEGGTADISVFYVPGIAALSVISACYTNIGMMVTISRDLGVLKRIRGTPLPPLAYLFGRIFHAMLVAALLVAIVVGAGALLYDVDVPGDTMPAFIVTVLIGSAAFCALGLALTALIPNADAAPAITNGTVLPLLFISDVFIPLQDPPEWLDTLGDIFPVKPFAEALQVSFNPYTTGSGFEWEKLAVVALWGIGGVLFALKFFSWEPRR